MRLLLYGLLSIMLVACGQRDQSPSTAPQFSAQPPVAVKSYVFAIHPLHNPQRLFEVYGPLVDYLNRQTPGVHLQLEASRNYEEFEKKLDARQPDFALPNPYQTLKALKHGYHVIAKMGDDDKFVGVVLVRRDSAIKTLADLKGRVVAYPGSTALAAAMMPQYYFQTHGLNVNTDIENRYVGSHESSIMNVYMGEVAAGVTWTLPWELFQREQPDKARQLEAKWVTAPLINNSVMARDDVPPELVQRVAQLLDTLHTTSEGKAILQRLPLSRFELANDQRYRVVGDFLRRFSRTVRPLDEVKK